MPRSAARNGSTARKRRSSPRSAPPAPAAAPLQKPPAVILTPEVICGHCMPQLLGFRFGAEDESRYDAEEMLIVRSPIRVLFMAGVLAFVAQQVRSATLHVPRTPRATHTLPCV